eukprot:756007-Hanusia_phi.AAC.3
MEGKPHVQRHKRESVVLGTPLYAHPVIGIPLERLEWTILRAFVCICEWFVSSLTYVVLCGVAWCLVCCSDCSKKSPCSSKLPRCCTLSGASSSAGSGFSFCSIGMSWPPAADLSSTSRASVTSVSTAISSVSPAPATASTDTYAVFFALRSPGSPRDSPVGGMLFSFLREHVRDGDDVWMWCGLQGCTAESFVRVTPPRAEGGRMLASAFCDEVSALWKRQRTWMQASTGAPGLWSEGWLCCLVDLKAGQLTFSLRVTGHGPEGGAVSVAGQNHSVTDARYLGHEVIFASASVACC